MPTSIQRRTLLQGAGVPAGMVERGEDLHCDPQLKHRRYFQFREHAEIGSCSHSRLPFVLSKTPGEVRMSAPLLGEHNDYVCTEILGLPDEKFVQMLQEGVFE